jgi:dTDP-4-dehydrorhamnose 3,5-epimerase-like enzyme
MYRVTEEYAPEVDRGIRWNDPELGVAWPIDEPILSAKDQAAPFLKDADNNYEYTGDLS